MKAKLKVNMHCASCAVNIKKTMKKIGVKSETNPVFKICKVDFDESKISLDEIKETIKGIGYEATEA